MIHLTVEIDLSGAFGKLNKFFEKDKKSVDKVVHI